MKRIAVIVADGAEEIEAVTPIDVLRRSGARVDIVSVDDMYTDGAHGIVLKGDTVIEGIDEDDYDAFVIPGGMTGATNISRNSYAKNVLTTAFREGKLIASICASPAVVLAKLGITDGRRVTCYPDDSLIATLSGATYTGAKVEIDSNLITADGPRSALDFSLAICAYLDLPVRI